MYCSSCGKEVANSDKFCSSCGTRLTATSPETAKKPAGSTASGREDKRDVETKTSSVNTSLAALTHILALFTWIWGPLIVLLASEDEFVKQNARNAMNWQIFLTIYLIVSFVLMIFIIGFLTFATVLILDMVFCIVAAIKASDNKAWKYPLTANLL